MPDVQMPDGQVVAFPDNPTDEQKKQLKQLFSSFGKSKEVRPPISGVEAPNNLRASMDASAE